MLIVINYSLTFTQNKQIYLITRRSYEYSMKSTTSFHQIALFGIICGLLLVSVILTGCTSSSSQSGATTTTLPAQTSGTSQAGTAMNATGTPAAVYTASTGSIVAFTAASLKGVSTKLGADFTAANPGNTVVFNLDGTQALKTQVENGAYADVFISASNSYTKTLTNEGYFVNGSVKQLTSNYLIVILPASNPANITSLADLANPKVKIAMEDKTVPAGTATVAVLANLANSTYSSDWNTSVFKNVVTYETSEPGVATKVALGEVDAGFVYESTYTAAPNGTYLAITIPKKDNYLQIYTAGVLNGSKNQALATSFENFLLSPAGQQDLSAYGFRPIS